jgi:copper homeostasis protein CutC
MAGMGAHMGVMEAVEARGSIMPEVVTFVSNKGLTNSAGIVEEIIVAPIAVIIWAVIAVVITVVIRPRSFSICFS